MTYEDFYILAYAVDGKAHYQFKGKKYSVKKGNILFFPKGFMHSAVSDPHEPWSFYSIAFDILFFNLFCQEKFLSIENVITTLPYVEYPTLFSELNWVWSGKRPGYLIRCRSIIMEILYFLIREMDLSYLNIPHTRTIERVVNKLQENYTKAYFIDQLAREAGMSSSYFRLLFKKITGFKPRQYQNSIKINKAKDLLLSGVCNVSEAAVMVGFNNIYYFSRLFKKITGVNPSTYLKG